MVLNQKKKTAEDSSQEKTPSRRGCRALAGEAGPMAFIIPKIPLRLVASLVSKSSTLDLKSSIADG